MLGAVRWDFRSVEGLGASQLAGRGLPGEGLCLAEQVLISLGPRRPHATRTLDWGRWGWGHGRGPGEGAGRTGQPGATLIWGLALTSKLAAWLECPAMVGVEAGCLVPIKLQKVTVASWGLWRRGGWHEGKVGDLDGGRWCGGALDAYSFVTLGLWLNFSGPLNSSSEKQGEQYLPPKAAPGLGPGPGLGDPSLCLCRSTNFCCKGHPCGPTVPPTDS